LKIVADAHISVKTTDVLRKMGHEVTDAPKHATDRDIIDLAKNLGAVIVTQDLDYSQLLAASQDAAPSVVSLRLRLPHPDRVTRVLADVLNCYKAVLLCGVILTVKDGGQVRVRPLPITAE
jgi:predicted nuclease of predicted toxin-antitoxin system